MAPQPLQDSVVGAIDGRPVGFFLIDARSGPSGEAPAGILNLEAGDVRQGTVFQSTGYSCLAVNANTAVVGGTGVLDTFGPGPTGPVQTTTTTGFVAVIVDNGDPPPPSPGEPIADSPDTFRLSFVTTPDCAAPPAGGVGFPGQGGFVVVDARPLLPTTKHRCKDGGWRTFGAAF